MNLGISRSIFEIIANNFTYQKVQFYTPSLCKYLRHLLHASLLYLDFDTEKQHCFFILRDQYDNIIISLM